MCQCLEPFLVITENHEPQMSAVLSLRNPALCSHLWKGRVRSNAGTVHSKSTLSSGWVSESCPRPLLCLQTMGFRCLLSQQTAIPVMTQTFCSLRRTKLCAYKVPGTYLPLPPLPSLPHHPPPHTKIHYEFKVQLLFLQHCRNGLQSLIC